VAPNGHVLIIEDNELVTGALRVLIESINHRVSTATTIAEALGHIASDPPDLALLDLTLPDGDGLQLVAPLHAAGCKNVVALTGRDEPSTRERCLAAGCAAVLVKPVPVRELLARISDWLA
jgi:DNA-binding response OmpR family regulator